MLTEISSSPHPDAIDKIIGVENEDIDQIAKSKVK